MGMYVWSGVTRSELSGQNFDIQENENPAVESVQGDDDVGNRIRPRVPSDLPEQSDNSQHQDRLPLSRYSAEFTVAENYFRFVAAYIDTARGGDADAQFYIYKALSYCDRYLEARRRQSGEWSTLDEALLAFDGYPDERRQAIVIDHDRCMDFRENGRDQFESSEYWLEQAVQAGHPIAQSETAYQSIVFGTPTSNEKRLLHDAIQSKRPEVFWNLGLILGNTDYFGPIDKVRAGAFLILACESGFDCSGQAAWVRRSCDTPSQPCVRDSDGYDQLKHQLGPDFDDAQLEARRLSRLLSEKRIDELGIDWDDLD